MGLLHEAAYNLTLRPPISQILSHTVNQEYNARLRPSPGQKTCLHLWFLVYNTINYLWFLKEFSNIFGFSDVFRRNATPTFFPIIIKFTVRLKKFHGSFLNKVLVVEISARQHHLNQLKKGSAWEFHCLQLWTKKNTKRNNFHRIII